MIGHVPEPDVAVPPPEDEERQRGGVASGDGGPRVHAVGHERTEGRVGRPGRAGVRREGTLEEAPDAGGHAVKHHDQPGETAVVGPHHQRQGHGVEVSRPKVPGGAVKETHGSAGLRRVQTDPRQPLGYHVRGDVNLVEDVPAEDVVPVQEHHEQRHGQRLGRILVAEHAPRSAAGAGGPVRDRALLHGGERFKHLGGVIGAAVHRVDGPARGPVVRTLLLAGARLDLPDAIAAAVGEEIALDRVVVEGDGAVEVDLGAGGVFRRPVPAGFRRLLPRGVHHHGPRVRAEPLLGAR